MAKESLLRQWAMLELIPRYPATATAGEIHERLQVLGHATSERTVQRDLNTLSELFPYTCSENGRTNYWFWPQKITSIQLPPPNLSTSLALHLAEQHLRPILPPSLLELLSPIFASAERVLADTSSTEAAHWPEKVHVFPSGPPLLPVKVDSDIQHTVYEAVFQSRKLTIKYQARNKNEPSKYNLSPLGLVSRDGVIYLVAAGAYSPFQLAMHRIQEASMMDEAAAPPNNFNLKNYAQQLKTFTTPKQPKPIQLKLSMHPPAAKHLAERPLSDNQTIANHEECSIVSATVDNTPELKWWLLGFGALVEVLEPSSLRKSFATTAEKMHNCYSEE